MQEFCPSVKLPREFYQRETIDVAHDLLGKILVHRTTEGGVLAGRIVETEAYIGPEDPACHAFGGRRTPRNEVMYHGGGFTYVYLIYGLHYCLNVVTQKHEPEAVLIRALEPVAGIERMQQLRRTQKLEILTSGPGRLCEALALNRSHNGLDLTSENLFITEDPQSTLLTNLGIASGPRIGIDYAGDAVFWPLRFAVKRSLYLSKPI